MVHIFNPFLIKKNCNVLLYERVINIKLLYLST